jgi:Chromate transporter
VSFSEAVRFWLKPGFISFGGPAWQISVMHQILIERKLWISEQHFFHALNYSLTLLLFEQEIVFHPCSIFYPAKACGAP